MSTPSISSSEFKAPTPGSWELEATHLTRPATRLTAQAMARSMREGFAESTARYGLGLSHFDVVQVNGFMYMKPIAFGAPPNASGPPPKLVLQVLTRLHPGMRARWRVADAAFKNKQWRLDLKRWDDEVKPASIRKHREIQAVDPASLSDDELFAYVARCHEHYEVMVVQHHQFTISAAMPVGDLLVHVHEWTGLPPGRVIDTLRGSSPVSKGVASDELDALGAVLREDADARALLDGALPPGEIVQALRDHGGKVGEATRAYLDMVGYRCLGYDLGEPYALELPDVLVRAIRVAATGEGKALSDGGQKERIAALRELVPAAHREAFDALLVEARHVNRLRDERGVYSDGWAIGLMRRALLALGARLQKKGLLDDGALLLDATWDEIKALAKAERAVGSEALRERATWRTTRTIADAPPWLGAPPSPPPPAEWFPEIARRAQRATVTFIGCLFQAAPEPEKKEETVTGLPVNAGVYEGTARLVNTDADFGKIQQGDVLLTRATSPYFNVVLPMLGAIVTDRGGQLSHAAIVAREFGIPGVVGTRDATARIPDGARVRVDGGSGRVTVIG
jgi:pyruvate,water dikinase